MLEADHFNWPDIEVVSLIKYRALQMKQFALLWCSGWYRGGGAGRWQGGNGVAAGTRVGVGW